MILLEFGLGVATNLYIDVPDKDHHSGAFAAFGHAVTGGPVVLSLHAILGTLIIISAITALVRSTRLRSRVAVVLTAASLIAVVTSWLSGANFVNDSSNVSSFAMAIGTAVALLGYTLMLFLAGMNQWWSRPLPQTSGLTDL
jgi:hypothetical protein